MTDPRQWVEPNNPHQLDFFDDLNRDIDNITDDIRQSFQTSLGWVRMSPLVLDLDGDGVELVAENGAAGAMFDHNGDGIKSATQWVKGDDGLLVWDRNGDGTINNGTELFGDNTVTASGGKAADGFAALAELDTNADGKVDVNDAAFGNLQIWRDLNGDGTSQANELLTLNQAGVASLNVSYTINPGSVEMPLVGSYTKTDGSTATLVDAYFAENPLVTESVAPVPISSEAAALPDLNGLGWVRDLQEAVTLNPGGPLQTVLTQYSAATTRTEQQALLDQLLSQWAATSGVGSSLDVHHTPGVDVFQSYAVTQSAPDGTSGASLSNDQLRVLEAFNGQWLFNYETTFQLAHGLAASDGKIGSSVDWKGVGSTGWSLSYKGDLLPLNGSTGWLAITYGFSQQQATLLNQSYAELRDYAYVGLLFQTRLKPYVDAIGLTLANGEFSLDFNAMQTLLANRVTADPVNGIADVVDLVRYAGQDLSAGGWDGYAFLQSELRRVTLDAPILALLADMDVQLGDTAANTMTGTTKADIVLAGEGNDILHGADKNDVLYGEAGDDTLYGDNGNDVLEGGTGNDYLTGGAGNDLYLFGPGSGQDVIDNNDNAAGRMDAIRITGGLKPADVQLARNGNSLIVYIPSSGDKLTVTNYFSGDGVNAFDMVNQIQFADGTVWDVEYIKVQSLLGTSLDDSISGTTGNDIIGGQGGNDNLTGKQGNDSISGGDGTDSLNGEAGDDTLRGGVGTDILLGEDGDDVLDGGADADTLYGGNGADTLDGGAGNDNMQGGYGNDTYLFGRGSGQDSLIDLDATVGNVDTIRFAADVAPADVRAVRSGNSLVLSIAGTTDTLTLPNYFAGNGVNSAYVVEQVQFANGTVWDMEAVKAQTLLGSAAAESLTGFTGNDLITGQGGNDILSGGEGNDSINGGADTDTLYGDNGNDMLDGGTGNDILNGGVGNDTYLFGRGSGQDSLTDYDPTAGNVDVIRFAADVTPADVVVSRNGNHLVFGIAGTTDTLTVNYFVAADAASPVYAVEQVQFADGTVWDIEAIKAQSMLGTAASNSMTGYTGNDVMEGRGGNDYLYGRDGNDTMSGGDGADSLSGENGNDLLYGGSDADALYGGNGADMLDGGTGNDILNGGAGNDTYLFGRGSGQDSLVDFDATVGNVDAIRFAADVTPADVVVSRNGNHLVFGIAGTTDTLTVNYFVAADAASPVYAVEQVQFADGTVWDIEAIKAQSMLGTAANNSMMGYTGNDVMEGRGGNDYLYGRDGNDTMSGGDGADSLSGENGNDTLNGGADNDQLYGGTGNDTLNGGTGNDSLNGGVGNDTYMFGRGSEQDNLTDYDPTLGNVDVLQIGADVSADQLWFKHVGNNLEISIIGSTDKVTLQNWYAGSAYHTEQIRTSNGQLLLDTQVENLVNAMAAFAPPAAGQSTLPPTYQDALAPVIAANWQAA